jgi:cytochrome c oxidase subunit 4
MNSDDDVMSNTAILAVEHAVEEQLAPEDHPDHTHDHPSDWVYIKVALVLGILTAIEVSTYFINDLSTGAALAMLMPLMVIKFAVVVLYFMHLKFDSSLFTRMFVAGLAFAIVVYGIMLTAQRFG